jgi:SAM-dependent methyltransferase
MAPSAEAAAMFSAMLSRALLIGGLVLLALAAVGFFLNRPEESSRAAQIFSGIYENRIWGTNEQGEGHSGPGSTLKSTVVYRAYLQAFLKDHAIRSVVDAGCGDWESTQAIDWTGIDYKGYDIVEAVIAKNRERFAAPNVHFFVGDIVEHKLPPADLLICKHVLQHLPNPDVHKFLRVLPRYKHALLLNSVDAATLTADNRDIMLGEYRPVDVMAKPFTVMGKKVLTYWDGLYMQQVVHVGPRH